jgi:hypothetical protein
LITEASITFGAAIMMLVGLVMAVLITSSAQSMMLKKLDH